MLFDAAPVELPTATLRPRGSGAWLFARLGDLQRWLSARLEWLRPRMVPMAVALAGLVIAAGVANYSGTPSRRASAALGRRLHTRGYQLEPTWGSVGPRCQLRPYIELTIADPDRP